MAKGNPFVVCLRGGEAYRAALDAMAEGMGLASRHLLAAEAIVALAKSRGITLPGRALPNGGRRDKGATYAIPIQAVVKQPQMYDTEAVVNHPQSCTTDKHPSTTANQLLTTEPQSYDTANHQSSTTEVVVKQPEPAPKVVKRPLEPAPAALRKVLSPRDRAKLGL